MYIIWIGLELYNHTRGTKGVFGASTFCIRAHQDETVDGTGQPIFSQAQNGDPIPPSIKNIQKGTPIHE